MQGRPETLTCQIPPTKFQVLVLELLGIQKLRDGGRDLESGEVSEVEKSVSWQRLIQGDNNQPVSPWCSDDLRG